MTHAQAERDIVYEATWPVDWCVDDPPPMLPWRVNVDETDALVQLIHDVADTRWLIEAIARARWTRRGCRVEDRMGHAHEIAPDLGPGDGVPFGSKFGATARVVS